MFVAIHGRKAIYMIGAILHDRLTNSRFEMQNLFADYVLAEISKFGIEDLPVDLKRLRGTTSQAALVGLVRGYGVLLRTLTPPRWSTLCPRRTWRSRLSASVTGRASSSLCVGRKNQSMRSDGFELVASHG